MNRLKIFCVYHKPAKIYKTGCLEPIQVGCAAAPFDLGILRDDTGANISYRNKDCCELTAQYWAWKNYLPENPDLEWIGFCHYRRFIDFGKPMPPGREDANSFFYVPPERFETDILPRYSEETMLDALPTAIGIALPSRFNTIRFRSVMEMHFLGMGGLGLEESAQTLKTYFPEYLPDFAAAEKADCGHIALTFLMRRDIFGRYASWTFSFLDAVRPLLEKSAKWIPGGRQEGYLMEHMFNTWLRHEMRTHGTAIAEFDGCILEPHAVAPHVNPLRKTIENLKFTAALAKARCRSFMFARRHFKPC